MVHLAAYGIEKRGQRFHHVLRVSADVEGLDRFEGTADQINLRRVLGLNAHRLGPIPPTDGVRTIHGVELAHAFILSRQIGQGQLVDRSFH